jgi:hypothetical protein
MGTGYTRADTANNIADGNIINASDLDSEYDAIQSAFDASTGHTHDGTAGEGAPIETIGPSQDVVATASVLRPKTDNTVDLGTTSLEYKDLFLDGTAHIDTLDVDENASITGTLGVTGTTTLGTANITTGTITTADINGGNIDGTIIGATSAAAITGTTITGTSFVTSGDMTFGDNDKAVFGAGSDLQIYHDGSASYIAESGTGGLNITGNGGNVSLYDASNSQYMVRANIGTDVELYYNGSEKLATTSTGVDITGTLTSDGLTVDGGTVAAAYAVITNTEGTAKFGTDSNYARILDGSNNILAALANAESYYYNNGAKVIKTASGGDISFYDSLGSSQSFFWDASAESLGIGNVSPTDKLHLGTSSGGTQLKIQSGSGVNNCILYTNGTTDSWRTGMNLALTNGSYEFYDDINNVDRMVIDSSGNVGIGTSSPTAKGHFFSGTSMTQLTVDGTGGIETGINFANGGATYGQIYFNNVSPYDMSVMQQYTTGSLVFGTNDTERMRIDSSGNLLVGKTTSGIGVTGSEILAGGQLLVTADGDNPADFNRKTSDGVIALFRKDSVTVGSIGSNNGFPYFGDGGNVALQLVDGSTDRIQPSTGTGAAADNSIDLGQGSNRFKDLYLSGGVYLGGTGAANKLDDYEEGNWTPVTNSGSWTVNSAKYTKVGAMVTCTFDVTATSTISANDFTGLPFTPSVNSAGVVGYQNSESGEVFGILVQSTSLWNFRVASTQKGLANGSLARGTFTFVTAS